MSSAIPLASAPGDTPALCSAIPAAAHADVLKRAAAASSANHTVQDDAVGASAAADAIAEEVAAAAFAHCMLERRKQHTPMDVSTIDSGNGVLHDFQATLMEATKNDQEYENLSMRRDDYYPSSLARDPKVERGQTEIIYMDGDKKRTFKKPREVSLVADYIRRFLKTEYFDVERPLKEQSDAVEILMRKLMIVFPHGDWTPYIVKSLIREKTKKKRSSAAAAMAMTMMHRSGETAEGKRRRLSADDLELGERRRESGGGAYARASLPLPLWAVELCTKVDENRAAIANLRLRRQNARLAEEGEALRPLQKERCGQLDCSALAPEMVSSPLLHKHEQVPKVGSTPTTMAEGGAFPNTTAAATQMSHDQVLQLMHFYNDDMNIVASDDLDTRIQKLLAWIRE